MGTEAKLFSRVPTLGSKNFNFYQNVLVIVNDHTKGNLRERKLKEKSNLGEKAT